MLRWARLLPVGVRGLLQALAISGVFPDLSVCALVARDVLGAAALIGLCAARCAGHAPSAGLAAFLLALRPLLLLSHSGQFLLFLLPSGRFLVKLRLSRGAVGIARDIEVTLFSWLFLSVLGQASLLLNQICRYLLLGEFLQKRACLALVGPAVNRFARCEP